MTSDLSIVDVAESLVHRMATRLTAPLAGECLCCYVSRQLEEFGCDNTTRHALRFRDLTAPRASALGERLGRIGAFCDCELFLNGYRWRSTDVPRNQIEVSRPGLEPLVIELPVCYGVRRGSTQPCRLWARQYR